MKLNKRPSVLMERRICSMPRDLPIKVIRKYILAHQNVWNMLVSGILIVWTAPTRPRHPGWVDVHCFILNERTFYCFWLILLSLVRESIGTLPEAMLSHSTNCELETTDSQFQYNYWTEKKKKKHVFMNLASILVRNLIWTVNQIRFEKISLYFTIKSNILHIPFILFLFFSVI